MIKDIYNKIKKGIKSIFFYVIAFFLYPTIWVIQKLKSLKK